MMNANVTLLNENMDSGEPTADLLVRTSSLQGCIIEGDLIPTLIDELPVIAVMACFAEGRRLAGRGGAEGKGIGRIAV